jgi:hypothetical protein
MFSLFVGTIRQNPSKRRQLLYYGRRANFPSCVASQRLDCRRPSDRELSSLVINVVRQMQHSQAFVVVMAPLSWFVNLYRKIPPPQDGGVIFWIL